MRTVVLASASPRRRALLEAAGWTVDVRPSAIDEVWPGGEVAAAAMALAAQKEAAVRTDPAALVLAADTVVWDDEPLHKPHDPATARATLARLSGRCHAVVTGVALRCGARRAAFAVRTEVAFRPLSGAEIDAYVATGEGLDRAGGYAIQGAGGALVDWLRGSYTNVVGLPLRQALAALAALGAPP